MTLTKTFKRFDPVRKLTQKGQPLLYSLRLTGFYLLWILFFKELVLIFTTYFLIPSRPLFQDITETLGSNEITLIGISALGFLLLLKWLYPLCYVTSDQIFNLPRLKKNFKLGFLHGAVLATGVILAFLLSQQHHFLGFFIQFDEAPIETINIILRIFGLTALAYCESFIFNFKIQSYLKNYPRITQILILSTLYCFIKTIQFDLGVMHLLTLFLIAVILSTRHSFEESAGFLTAILIIFHVLVSLPVFGNEFSGVFHVKYQGLQSADIDNTSIRLLTGGAGGPFSSIAFQLVLIVHIIRTLLKYPSQSLE